MGLIAIAISLFKATAGQLPGHPHLSRESEWPLRVPQGTQAEFMIMKRVELHVKC